MVTHLVKWLLASLVCYSLPLIAYSNNFSAESLRAQSTDNEDAFSTSAQRLKSLQNEGLEVLDQDAVIYEIDGKTFAGFILPNGAVVPSIVNSITGAKRPACLDRFFQLHPAEYDPSSGKITCQVRSADLLDTVDIQTSVGNKVAIPAPTIKAAAPSEPEPVEEPIVIDRSNSEPVVVAKVEESTQTPVPTVASAEPPVQVQRPAQRVTNEVSAQVTPAPAAVPDDWYLPPIRSNNASRSSSLTIKEADQSLFGVTKGAWIKAEITRRVRSSDRGEIELHTLDTIYGDNETIPAGTRLFASPSFNSGSSRLDLTVTNFILEDEEYRMQAAVYDRLKEYGIAGRIIRSRSSEVTAAGGQAILETVNSAVDALPIGSNPVSVGAESFTGSLIDYEADYLPDDQAGVVEVAPQIVYLQVMASF